jgi:hypothetical protein
MYQGQKMLSLQAQDRQLGYDILGRLLSAAENYYLKCQGKSYDYQKANYASHDIFQNANKKSKEAIRRELINQINIFQTSNQYFINKYKFGLQPPNIQQVIDDIILWKSAMTNKKDIELYEGILTIINDNKNINTDNYLIGNENAGYTNMARQEFWSNMGTHASAATQNRIKNMHETENFQPTLQRGNRNDPYQDSHMKEVNEIMKLSTEANQVISEIYGMMFEYNQKINQRQFIIKNINKKVIKLNNLINEIHNRNSAYLFPQSQFRREDFLKDLNILYNNETIKENKNIFRELKNLFSEDSDYL